MSTRTTEWISRWQPRDLELSSLKDTLDEEISDPTVELMDEADELPVINKQLLAEFEPFVLKVKELIDVLCATDTAQPFWNLPVDTISVKLHHFCIVNSELLELMYNNPNFDQEVTKNIETIQAVRTALTSHNLNNQRNISSLLIELHQALQILDLD